MRRRPSRLQGFFIFVIFFFFSSRRRHTRLQGDWSSDVCSSDLSRNPYGCVFWPTYLLPFLDRDAAALGRFRFAAGCGAARLRVAGGSALASAVPALTGGGGGASPPATWISTWLGRFKIGVARPIAAWVKRLRVGPSFTTAYWTRSRSASKAAFSRCACCSAFATADFSTLWICFAASFFEKRRMAYASGTARPRIWSMTSRILRADWRTVR